jgi:hypothetical protein
MCIFKISDVQTPFHLGNVDRFTKHLIRTFDTDGNGFLNFKEFLVAMNVSKCNSGWKYTNFESISYLTIILDYINKNLAEQVKFKPFKPSINVHVTYVT